MGRPTYGRNVRKTEVTNRAREPWPDPEPHSERNGSIARYRAQLANLLAIRDRYSLVPENCSLNRRIATLEEAIAVLEETGEDLGVADPLLS